MKCCEYAFHFVRLLRQKPEVEEVILLVDELPAGEVTLYVGHMDYNGNEVIEKSEIDRFEQMFNNGRGALNCTVKDLSECGARIKLGGWLNLPRQFEIHLDRGARFRCEMVRFVDNCMSVRFIETLAEAA